ncbi:hypothetical protein PLICRDRAFT_170411 [Plicaturopsis crispa FD-325 SS-3]|nr:hypothetical protein PLICRDRAFT_170411 [Plicaturopsis crispa FD-325 SS-3]
MLASVLNATGLWGCGTDFAQRAPTPRTQWAARWDAPHPSRVPSPSSPLWRKVGGSPRSPDETSSMKLRPSYPTYTVAPSPSCLPPPSPKGGHPTIVHGRCDQADIEKPAEARPPVNLIVGRRLPLNDALFMPTPKLVKATFDSPESPYEPATPPGLSRGITTSVTWPLPLPPSPVTFCTRPSTVDSVESAWTLALWLSDVTYAIFTSDAAAFPLPIGHALPPSSASVRAEAAQYIYHWIMEALCPSATYFLALLYITISKKRGTGLACTHHEVTPGCIADALLAATILANKWLDDGSYTLKRWQEASQLPPASVRSLERQGLEALGYNIAVGVNEFQLWISHLCDYQAGLTRFQPISRYAPMEQVLINRLLAVYTTPAVKAHYQPCGPFTFRLYNNASTPPSPPRVMPPATCEYLTEDEWCPDNDEIVSRPKKTIGIAPGTWSSVRV